MADDNPLEAKPLRTSRFPNEDVAYRAHRDALLREEIELKRHIGGRTVGKVILTMTMSLDGFVNDRNGSVERLYPDLEALRKTESLQERMGCQ